MHLNNGRRFPRIGRLAMQFGLALALAMGVAGTIVFAVACHQLIDETDESLQSERDKLIPAGQSAEAAAIVPRIAARSARRFISTKGYLLYGADGRSLWGGVEMPMPAEGFGSQISQRHDSKRRRECSAAKLKLPPKAA